MKKKTTTLQLLEEGLVAVAESLATTARFDLSQPEIRDWIDVDNFERAFFVLGDALPAPPRGRGDRSRVCVGWLWFPSHIAADRGAVMTASLIAKIPGVEEVGEPKLDPLLHVFWALDVVVRLSQ